MVETNNISRMAWQNGMNNVAQWTSIDTLAYIK